MWKFIFSATTECKFVLKKWLFNDRQLLTSFYAAQMLKSYISDFNRFYCLRVHGLLIQAETLLWVQRASASENLVNPFLLNLLIWSYFYSVLRSVRPVAKGGVGGLGWGWFSENEAGSRTVKILSPFSKISSTQSVCSCTWRLYNQKHTSATVNPNIQLFSVRLQPWFEFLQVKNNKLSIACKFTLFFLQVIFA